MKLGTPAIQYELLVIGCEGHLLLCLQQFATKYGHNSHPVVVVLITSSC
jgi:hypothetical protein